VTSDPTARIRELISDINFMTGGYAGDELEWLVELRAAGVGQEPSMDLTGRHPGTVAVAKHFAHEHLPPHLAAISKPCHDLAEQLLAVLPDGPELTAGLRKLLEAKDCFVRAALDVPHD
jgi:hypothetical protein